MKSIKIGLLGFGTVSGGFYRQLEIASLQIEKQFGVKPRVEKILIKRGDASHYGHDIQKRLVYDFEDILQDPDIQVIVEAINGAEPAATFIEQALIKGKHVITANKAAVASKWKELQSASTTGGGKLYFEASVCGGIPIVETLKTLKLSDEVLSVEGIVNGTTNYILSLMASSGMSYEAALDQAKDLGYSEQNPSADVDGLDAANKLAILCGLCFDHPILPEHIEKESIRNLISAKNGLKVIASASFENQQIKTSVALKQLEQDHPLFSVNGVENGIVIKTKAIGQLRLYGPGAGSSPTGTSMISDLVSLIQGGHVKEINIH